MEITSSCAGEKAEQEERKGGRKEKKRKVDGKRGRGGEREKKSSTKLAWTALNSVGFLCNSINVYRPPGLPALFQKQRHLKIQATGLVLKALESSVRV